MSPELEQQLYEKYPEIFVQHKWDPRNSAMCFGFEHGDGWYNILDVLCFALMQTVKTCRDRLNWLENIGVGNEKWTNGDKVTEEEIKDARYKLDEALRELPRATQVKEKFGGLRFYVTRANTEEESYLYFAELMSTHTCEVCGSPGKSQGKGWIRTLCDGHAKTD